MLCAKDSGHQSRSFFCREDQVRSARKLGDPDSEGHRRTPTGYLCDEDLGDTTLRLHVASCTGRETEDFITTGLSQAHASQGWSPVQRVTHIPGPPLTVLALALAQTLHNRVAMSYVLPTEPALARAGAVAGTGSTIPSTVWVPGQAALSTGTAISLTLVQLQPGHTQ